MNFSLQLKLKNNSNPIRKLFVTFFQFIGVIFQVYMSICFRFLSVKYIIIILACVTVYFKSNMTKKNIPKRTMTEKNINRKK